MINANLLSSVLDRIKAKQQTYLFISGEVEELNKEWNELTNELEELEGHLETSEKVQVACKALVEALTKVNKTNLENFLTFAVKTIFSDRNYEVKFILKEETKRPGLEFTLVEDGIEQGITDAVGGGIISVLGLLSQIYFLELYGLEKVLFIDEGLKEVSGYNSTGDINYLQNTLSFLKYLAENKGYMFVIITHDTYVKDIADVVYGVESGKVRKLK